MEARAFNLLEQQDLIRKIVADRSSSTFFILNNSDRPDSRNIATRESGPVLFTVLVDGVSRIIRVPMSWVPVDAGMQAPKAAIAASAEFQVALMSKAIIVIEDATARTIISADNESQQEYSRVMAVAQNINGMVGNRGQMPGVGDIGEEEDKWANVSASVKMNVSAVKNSEMDIMSFRSFMRREERSISSLDRGYIAEHLPELANSNVGVPIQPV